MVPVRVPPAASAPCCSAVELKGCVKDMAERGRVLEGDPATSALSGIRLTLGVIVDMAETGRTRPDGSACDGSPEDKREDGGRGG